MDYTNSDYDIIYASAPTTWAVTYTITFSYNTNTGSAANGYDGVLLAVYAGAYNNNQNAPWGIGAFNMNSNFYKNALGVRGACY